MSKRIRRRLTLLCGCALAAWAAYWYAFGVPLRPPGVTADYAFVRLDTGQFQNRGVWIGCTRDPKQWDTANCRIIGQKGDVGLEAVYRSFPPGAPLPMQPLQPSMHTDWYEGIFGGPGRSRADYEPFIWLRGCILLLPADAYERAQAKFKKDLASAAGLQQPLPD